MHKDNKTQLDIYIPGLIDYHRALEIQHKLVQKRIAEEIPDSLILLEHPPVITYGRGGNMENLLLDIGSLKDKGIDFYEIERGGDITFHSPGQLVGYPIIKLDTRGRDMHKYLRDLEGVLIGVLNEFGLDAGRKEKYTGVWIEDKKLAAIGVAVKRWVSFHGFALNVNNDLSYFDYIIPCGIKEYSVSSISAEFGKFVDLKDVIPIIIKIFREIFSYNEIYYRSAEELNKL